MAGAAWILIRRAGNEEPLGPPPSECSCLPPEEPKFYWAKSPLGLAGPNLSSPASKDMPGCSVAGAIITPISILNLSLKD